MKKWLFLLMSLLLAGSVLITACGSGAPKATPTPTGPVGDPVAGKASYDKTCITCHGPDAKGMPNLGKDLTTSQFSKSKSDAELVDFIKIGRPASDPANEAGVDMPPRGGNPALTDQDLLNIVAFVRTLEQ